MPWFRITDKGTIERSALIEAPDKEAARDVDCSIPTDEAEVEWIERLVEDADPQELEWLEPPEE